MTVAAEFHVQASGIVECFESFEDWREIDCSFAESQVVVNTAFHVFDVDRENSIVPCFEIARNWLWFQTMHVADVDRESETGAIDQRE